MNRSQQARFAILSTLKDSVGFLTPESSLFAWVNLKLPEPITTIEFASALRELESLKRILCQPDEDRQNKWKITDNGLARLQELGG